MSEKTMSPWRTPSKTVSQKRRS
jgi:hypothetical protein